MTVLREDFEEVRLLNHIKTSGLLTSFTDLDGNAQGATPSTAGIIDMTKVDPNSRAVQVRLSGVDQFSTGSIPMSQYPASVNVFSKVGFDDSETTKGLTKSIRDWMRVNYQSDSECIIAITAQGIGGPYLMEDNRVYYEIPLIVKFTAVSG